MKRPIDFIAINAVALRALPVILPRWLPDGRRQGREFVAKNPTRADGSPGSFSINVATGRWSDFATGDRGGDAVSLTAYLFGLSQVDAARRLADMLNIRVEEKR
jgi:DNA primase